jgi:hypothetical protein
MTTRRLLPLLLAAPALALASTVPPGARNTLIVVKGAAGEPDYAPIFQTQVEAWKSAATTAGAGIVVIGGQPPGPATDRDLLEKSLASTPADGPGELWIVLIGHGTWDGKTARFNLEGPDFSAADLAAWLQPVKRPVAVINTASCSGPFLNALAAPGRVVITATRSGSERNYARLGEHFATALADPAADYDQDGRVSLLECFVAAAARTAEFYKNEGRIATEHALIDDNGDGKGTPADWFRGLRPVRKSKDNTPLDGTRAHQRSLAPDDAAHRMAPHQLAARDQLESDIAALRERKSTLPEDEYYSLLEPLLLQLADLYRDP